MMRIILALALLLLPLRGLAAQVTPPVPAPGGEELVDRVVAVVGDTALLLSDLRTAVQQAQAAGQTLPTDPVQRDAFMSAILDDRVNSLLLVEAARDAGITVDEDQINGLVDSQVSRILQSFGGSQPQLDAALAADGMTMSQYRDLLAQQFRDDQLVRSYMGERMRARARPVISEDEIRAAFEARRAQLGNRPASVTFSQVLVRPEAGDSADAAARREAEDVLKQLREGGDWEVLARRFSDDPGTKEVGGELGWVKQNGQMVPEFERAVFAGRPGDLLPVKTAFGYHILQVRRTQGAERQVRHILVSPEITAEDVERARVRADSVAGALREGANLRMLARAYGTPEDQIEIPPQPVDNLHAAYREPLAEAQPGAVVGPFRVPGLGEESWAVVKVTDRRPEGEFVLEDVRQQLVEGLQEQRMMAQIVEDLRNSIYVSIRMSVRRKRFASTCSCTVSV
jgi:peptidyl-prolyl cis-trans isomerase SurA